MARALELAVAFEILTGRESTSLCAWCLEKADPTESTHVARRAPDGGDCMRCPYSGRDVFVVVLPLVTK